MSDGRATLRSGSSGPSGRGVAVDCGTGAHFAVQLVERGLNPFQNLVTLRREAIHPGILGAFRLGGAKPAALGHARQDRIQRARTEAIAVVAQFLEHPLTVDATSVGRVVEDVNLPEREEELTRNWITHDQAAS